MGIHDRDWFHENPSTQTQKEQQTAQRRVGFHFRFSDNASPWWEIGVKLAFAPYPLLTIYLLKKVVSIGWAIK